MLTKRAITTCAAVALATVFTVQQGEHGPLVVYKLKVPKEAAQTVGTPATNTPGTAAPTAQTPSATAPASGTPASGTPASGTPAQKAKTRKLSSLTPTVLGRVVMPAGARPGVSTVPPAALALPRTAPPSTVSPPTATPLNATPPNAAAVTVAPLTAADRAIVAPASATVHAGFASPVSDPVYRSVSGLPVGDSLMNEETGEPLTLDAVQDVIEWRRDTVEGLPPLQSTPRF